MDWGLHSLRRGSDSNNSGQCSVGLENDSAGGAGCGARSNLNGANRSSSGPVHAEAVKTREGWHICNISRARTQTAGVVAATGHVFWGRRCIDFRRKIRMTALVDMDSLSRGALDGAASGKPRSREHTGGADREHHQDRN